MIKTIHNHTFKDNILKKGGWVLDLGCNDFIFSKYMVDRGMKVIGLDPIKNINIPNDLKDNPNFLYLQNACVGNKTAETAIYYEYVGWGANSIVNTPELLHRKENSGHAKNPFKTSYEVPLTTIEELMLKYNINEFEFIKIDIEGSEYNLIENLPSNCVKQFSVEFHDFLGLNPSDNVEEYHQNLTNNILTDFNKEFETKDRDDVLYIKKEL
jgi:FkbM family methyltransferase